MRRDIDVGDDSKKPAGARRARIFILVAGLCSLALTTALLLIPGWRDSAQPYAPAMLGGLAAVFLLAAWRAPDRWIMRLEMWLTGWP